MSTKELYDLIDSLIITADRHEVPYITLTINDAIAVRDTIIDNINKDMVIEEFENQVMDLQVENADLQYQVDCLNSELCEDYDAEDE